MSVFFPEEEVRSVYDFPFESLTARGIRGIVFDIDNTLVPPDAPADARCRALVRASQRLCRQCRRQAVALFADSAR